MNTDIVILAAADLKNIPVQRHLYVLDRDVFFLKNKGDWLMKENTGLRKTTLAALFLAIGLILPFITMQIPAVGKMLCPMHIPVLLCGYVCGWPYGLIVGIITPLLRGVLFGMPAIFPNAVCMAFELATYGFVAGILSKKMTEI